jgi:hypothetical protein
MAPTDHEWEKWRPNFPTCSHWYTPEGFRDLVAALIAAEREGGKAWTVRELVSQFAGLRGSAKQKEVTEAVGLSRSQLGELADEDKVDFAHAKALLKAMQKESRAVRSKALGIIGEDHLRRRLSRYYGVEDGGSIKYKCVLGKKGIPFVLEVAFGVKSADAEEERTIICGVNWTPCLTVPFNELSELLGENRVDSFDPVVVCVHLAYPCAKFTDRGKTHLAIPFEIREALAKCLRLVARDWKKAKRQADINDRIHERELEELRRGNSRKDMSRKAAAWEVMEKAFLFVVHNDKSNPAHARQIMYRVRKLILPMTGGKFWKKSSTFTQKVLPEFVEAHPQLTKDWNIVYDARGHLTEPHTGRRIELGTLAVRQYIQDWKNKSKETPDDLKLDMGYPTSGPANRYKYVLFVEKEGFDEHLKKHKIRELYDVPIMSTKGMSVTAARELAEAWAELGVTILVLHDFDKSGFSILHTLQHDSPRYKFGTKPIVVDIGLRWEDVLALRLEGEPVRYSGAKKDPRINLRRNGATEEECAFLVRPNGPPWVGMRCELNELTTLEFIDLIKRKFEALGIQKVVPDQATLEEAYRLAWRKAKVQDAIDRAQKKANGVFPALPSDLAEKVAERIKGTPKSWDEAIYELVRQRRK